MSDRFVSRSDERDPNVCPVFSAQENQSSNDTRNSRDDQSFTRDVSRVSQEIYAPRELNRG